KPPRSPKLGLILTPKCTHYTLLRKVVRRLRRTQADGLAMGLRPKPQPPGRCWTWPTRARRAQVRCPHRKGGDSPTGSGLAHRSPADMDNSAAHTAGVWTDCPELTMCQPSDLK